MEALPSLLRVVLTGSESTGKTTLARALAGLYRTSCSREFAREYVQRKDSPLRFEDVGPIAHGQIAREDAAARRANRVVFLDTDLLSTVIYSRHYYGSCPDWIAKAARQRRGDLYLLHHPDVPWVADGASRDRPEERDLIHGLFRRALGELGAHSVDIRGTWEERRARALEAIEALLSQQRLREAR